MTQSKRKSRLKKLYWVYIFSRTSGHEGFDFQPLNNIYQFINPLKKYNLVSCLCLLLQ